MQGPHAMADLSHWDFAEHFDGYDAAALILGLEPRESEGEQWRVRVVTDRMEMHYQAALERIFRETLSNPEDKGIAEGSSNSVELLSVKLRHLHHRCWLHGEETPLSDWLASRHQPKFENQKFDRSAVVCWLNAIGMKSLYQFDRKAAALQPTISSRWPWGGHHTELLGHLEAAALKFWVNYDPTDATTAPTNAAVAEWLQSDRKVSRTMADAIASMLRVDGLPTGPRK